MKIYKKNTPAKANFFIVLYKIKKQCIVADMKESLITQSAKRSGHIPVTLELLTKTVILHKSLLSFLSKAVFLGHCVCITKLFQHINEALKHTAKISILCK